MQEEIKAGGVGRVHENDGDACFHLSLISRWKVLHLVKLRNSIQMVVRKGLADGTRVLLTVYIPFDERYTSDSDDLAYQGQIL